MLPQPHLSSQVVRCLLVLAAVAATGCQFTRPFGVEPGPRIAYELPPRELRKTLLPEYVIEPPDVLTIDAVNLVPRDPYLLRPFDVLSVQATGLPRDQPLPGTGEFTVGVDGTLVLGGGYDVVEEDSDGGKAETDDDEQPVRRYAPLRVVGKPVTEVRDLIQERLGAVARNPEVWVSILQLAPQQGIAGEHLVGPDGTINLGAYGGVRVTGFTVPEAKAAIEAQLATRFENPEVAVDVYGYNSKVYYVVTQGAGLGDRVLPFPVTGNETALDAIGQVQGLTATSSTRMWIARPGKNPCGGDQILPVDWLSISQRGDTTTNYQLLPGDRLFVAEDKLVALDTTLAKFISPIERIFGVTLLGTQTARQIRFFNVPPTGGGGVGF